MKQLSGMLKEEVRRLQKKEMANDDQDVDEVDEEDGEDSAAE